MAGQPRRIASHTSILLCILWLTMHPVYAVRRGNTDSTETVINLDGFMLSTQAPVINEVSPPCLYELQKLQNDTGKLVPVLDSYGKPASGILAGNLAWLGHFDQCMEIQSFRHCLVGMGANITALLKVLPIQWGVCAPEVCSEEDVRNSLEILLDILDLPWLTITNLEGSAVSCTEKPNTNFDTGFILTCILISSLVALTLVGSIVDFFLRRSSQAHISTPSEKANGNIAVIAASGGRDVKGQRLTEKQQGEVSNHNDQMAVAYEEENEINNEDKTNSPNHLTEKMPLLKSAIPPTLTSMPAEDIQHNSKPNLLVRLLLCFAMSRNLPKLLGTNQADGGIPCLNGIRVISVSWVILFHTLIFVLQPTSNENLLSAVFGRWLHHFAFQPIANAVLSVDTFFFLSGMLITFHTLKKMKETGGKIPWLWFYIHRYIRLTPTLALLILVLTFILPNLNQGPEWFRLGRNIGNCKSYWWTDLLYINNLVNDDLTDCVDWGWYLASDMQFFVISPLFILTLFWFPVFGITALAVTCGASFITTSVLVYQNDFGPGWFFSMAGIFAQSSGAYLGGNLNFHSSIYVKPYCRIPPYLVGMAMGYCLYKIESGRRQVKLSHVSAAGGWAIAGALGVAVVFGLYDVDRGASTPSMADSIAYNSLAPFTWAIALCWVVFACHYGYGGIVNDFLSWSFWVPLSRLSYCAYLFHPVVIYNYSYGQAVPFHWSAVNFIYMFASFLLLGHFLALLVTLSLEIPVGNLEKMLREALTCKKQVNGQNSSKP